MIESILSQNWIPLLTLTPLWLSSLLDLTGCVWRILTCHCTSDHSQLPLMRPCFSTFSQQHHPLVPRLFCLPCLMLVIGSMVFHLPHRSGSSPSGPIVSLLPICYWLGVPLHCSSYSCPECHNTADPFGDHQVGCGSNGDSITRHNAIRDVIFIVLPKFAALAPVKEMPNLNSDSLKTLLMSSHLEPWPASCS